MRTRATTEGNGEGAFLRVRLVFQYRRFRDPLALPATVLSHLTCFFLEEYLDAVSSLIADDHPLSFRGFIALQGSGLDERAVTVGMVSILAAGGMWFTAIGSANTRSFAKPATEPPSAIFAVPLLQNHAPTAFTATRGVVYPPAFVLK